MSKPTSQRHEDLKKLEETHTWHGCVHGYDTRIKMPCPSCGSRSLFIGSGGHITCGYLPCKSPLLSENIKLKADLADVVPKDCLVITKEVYEELSGRYRSAAKKEQDLRVELVSQIQKRDEQIDTLTLALAEARECLMEIVKEHKENEGEIFYLCQPDKGDVFSKYDNIAVIAKDALSNPTSIQASEEMKAMRKVVEASRAVVPGYLRKEKVDIKTLEEILKQEGSANVYINPDGSITANHDMENLREKLKALEAYESRGKV